ncbi:NAD(P)-dependent oxidoreductase [[Pseudomonas] boreopolis]|uniref:NAD(P)-dependent oxidoreductase n=1 Tax=Xanthomonas boreopolis TaxID=86183 RepID=UPI003DA0DF9D
MPLFPLFADLRGRTVLVIGGGEVASRKIKALLHAGAHVVVHAREWIPELQDLLDRRQLQRLDGEFDPAWIDAAWLVVAATDDAALNRRVAEAAGARRRWVNVVDDAELSSYQVPAIVDRDPILVAISSAGAAPMLARRLRERLETELDHSLGALAELFSRHRARIRERLPDMALRRRWFERVLDGEVPVLLRNGDAERARQAFEAALDAAGDLPVRGSAALVGCGDGDPGLLTLKALRQLNLADLILAAPDVAPAILDLARRDAEAHRVAPDAATLLPQVLASVEAGRKVVCLRAGAGFVDEAGRGLLLALQERGIACELVPGAVEPATID